MHMTMLLCTLTKVYPYDNIGMPDSSAINRFYICVNMENSTPLETKSNYLSNLLNYL